MSKYYSLCCDCFETQTQTTTDTLLALSFHSPQLTFLIDCSEIENCTVIVVEGSESVSSHPTQRSESDLNTCTVVESLSSLTIVIITSCEDGKCSTLASQEIVVVVTT